MKDFPNDNFKFDENGRMFAKKVANKRRNCSLQLFFFYSVFKRLVLQTGKYLGLVWERVEPSFSLSIDHMYFKLKSLASC